MTARKGQEGPNGPITVESTGEGAPGPRRRDEPLGLLTTLDERRFVVGAERARGGMGRILETHDDLLGRRVALKQLQRPDDGRAMAQFMREAMITARLQHPGIVPVYDAGVRRSGEAYYAMPLVPGSDLRQVIGETRHLDERLALLPHVQAVADAVAYAHEQGVIHRDLKPANVLIGPFGETVVIDWGLAKDSVAGEAGGSDEVLVDLGLPLDATRTGVARGTPAYMSPEQARGDKADARTDVYALGAMLYHVLAGKAPHDSAQAASSGLVTPIQKLEPRVPPDLAAVVGKAMAAAPADRYPTAKLFAADLRRFATGQLVSAHRYGVGTLVRRFAARHKVALVAAFLVAALTAAIAIPVAHQAGAAPRCEGEEDLVAKVWNPARAANIRAHLERLAGPLGTEQWDRAAPVFTAYAERWAKMRHQACVATRVEHAQSDSLFDRRLYCLDRRLAALDGIAGGLAAIDSRTVAVKVTDVAGGLPPLAACEASSWLADSPLPPLERRAAIEETFRGLDAARASAQLGRHKDALAAMRGLEARAAELEFAPLRAELSFELAFSAEAAGELEYAAREYEKAEALAAGLGRVDRVFEIELRLMRMEAHANHFDRARARRVVLASLAALSPNVNHPAMLHETIGTALNWEGKYAESLEAQQKAMAVMPPGSPHEALIQQAMGYAFMRLKRLDEAEAPLTRALSLEEQRSGGKHPRVAKALSALGNLAFYRKRHDQALDYYRRALAIHESVSAGEPTADIAIALGNVGVAEEGRGDYAAALVTYERALAQRRKIFGDDHFEVARTLTNKANALVRLGRWDDALAALRESLAIRGRVQPPTHPDRISTHGDISETLLIRARPGDAEEGLATVDRGLLLARAPGREDDGLAGYLMVARAHALLALGRHAAARGEAERAVASMRAAKFDDAETHALAAEIIAEVDLAARKPRQVIAALEPMLAGEELDLAHSRLAVLLARAYAADGRRDEARAWAQRAQTALEKIRDVRAQPPAEAARALLGP